MSVPSRNNKQKSSRLTRLLSHLSRLGRKPETHKDITSRPFSAVVRPKPLWSPASIESFGSDEFKHLPRQRRSLSIRSQSRTNLTELSELEEDQEQMQSVFFELPKDVRQRIYKYVFLGRSQVFHIVRRTSHKLAFHRCKLLAGDEGAGWPIECWDIGCRGWKMEGGMFYGSGDSGILPLLQSCRMMYSEAIPVLYSIPTFDFDSIESLIAFSCSVLPRRFDSIKYMQLDFRFAMSNFYNESMPKTDPERWERMWRIISSLPKLESLRVRLTWPAAEVEKQQEDQLLEPLKMVTGLKTFEVMVPWPREDKDLTKERKGSQPLECKVIRTDRVSSGLEGLGRRATVY